MTAPDLRATIAAALAAPGAPTQAALCAAVAPTWGVSPESAKQALSHWLAGRRPIPLRAVEAIMGALQSPKKVIAAAAASQAARVAKPRPRPRENRALYACKRCGETGHNRRTCPWEEGVLTFEI